MMKRLLTFFLTVYLIILLSSSAQADLLRLRIGRVIDGKFLGGTEHAVRFHTKDGTVEFSVEEILSITFLPAAEKLPERTPMPTPTPTAQPEQQEFTLPSDTRLSVRTLYMIDSLISRQGDTFDATLETDLKVDEVLVIPRGTPIKGMVLRSDHDQNGSALVITLRQFVLKGQQIPIATTSYAMWDQPRSDSDTGMRSIRTLRIPAKAFLEFRTTEPVTLTRQQLGL
jgi:hypothetical protein